MPRRVFIFAPLGAALLVLVAGGWQGGLQEHAQGSHSTTDTDADGVADVDEGLCGGNASIAAIRPERLDTPGDDDGDTIAGEALPAGSEGSDCDGDGWKGSQEVAIFAASTTANDQDPCGNNGWPLDLYESPSNAFSSTDWHTFYSPPYTDDGHGTYPYLFHTVPDDGRTNEERWDLEPANGFIDVGDWNTFNPAVGSPTARPPMLQGQPAFGEACANPSGSAPPPEQTAHSTAGIDAVSIDMDHTGNGSPAVGMRYFNEPLPVAEGTPVGACTFTAWYGTTNDAEDDDADGSVNDGCPPIASPETSGQCSNNTDDDGDTTTNDGCPSVGTPEMGVCGNNIDDDPADTSGDTITDFDGGADDGCQVALSGRESCAEIIDDDILNSDEDQLGTGGQDRASLDITVGAQPGPGGGVPAARPMTAFQYSLTWDVDAVDVDINNVGFLIRAGGSASPISIFTPPLPQLNSLTVATNDAGPGESEPGVFARITMEGNAAGIATLSLGSVVIKDGMNETIPITTVVSARLAVSKDGPDPGSAIGDSPGEEYLCPPDDLDDDDDLVADADEVGCGADPVSPGQRPERLDTPGDDDGDAAINEALPAGSEQLDCDGDGWTGSQEMLIFGASSSTNDQDPCGANGWAAELVGDDNRLNIADLNSFLLPLRGDGSFNKFNHPLDEDGNTVVDQTMARWNLQLPPQVSATVINVGDLNTLITGAVGSPARPQMSGGQPAFFTNSGQCPFPP